MKATVLPKKKADRTIDVEPPGTSDSTDTVSVLIGALDAATKAGRFDVVMQIARELEARRVDSAPNVVPLPRRAAR